MKQKEKVDEVAEKLYDLVRLEKYSIEVSIPKKGGKVVQVKSKHPMNHTKKWMTKNR